MYTCRWFVLCETVVHDSGSNNLTMVNALTELRASHFPALHPRFAFATLLDRAGEPEGALSLRFVRETDDGDEVLLTVGNEATPERAQFFINFPAGIRLFGEGKVTFRIEAQEGENEWYAVGSQDIVVVAVPQPPPIAEPDDADPDAESPQTVGE
jgi:hypothetical protein